MLGEVGIWRAIWWPAVSGIFMQKIVKIHQSFLKLQSIMSGSLFWDTVYFAATFSCPLIFHFQTWPGCPLCSFFPSHDFLSRDWAMCADHHDYSSGKISKCDHNLHQQSQWVIILSHFVPLCFYPWSNFYNTLTSFSMTNFNELCLLTLYRR